MSEINIETEESKLEKHESPKEDSCLPCFKVSVRGLVSFSVKDDEAWSFSSYRLAQEGTLAHVKLQANNRQSGNYTSEVYLSKAFEAPGCILEVSGRADGLWRFDDQVILQEIKTSATPLEEIGPNFSEAHWAQAKCYAYLLASIEELDEVTVRLTYYDKDNDHEKSFDKRFTRTRLERFFKTLFYPYVSWILSREKWKDIRNISISRLVFPFENYRKGQKLLAYNTYKCIEDEKRLFVQAPTGTGKTMGVLYPAIKALGEGKLDRLFYITAKTTTRGIAENAVKLLSEQGLRLKVLTLTAKEKQCLNTVKNCAPDKCPFIKGFSSKSRKVVKDLLKKYDFFPKQLISDTGLRHGICPFELSLELAMGCDLIICDYNYVFDPRVNLKRFFQQKGRDKFLIMVDEAHNLFDRAREMYSATISAKELTELSREIKKELPDINKNIGALKKALSGIEKSVADNLREAGSVKYSSSTEPPLELFPLLEAFIFNTENWILTNEEESSYSDRLTTLFFDLLHFKNILELYSDKYRTLVTGTKSNLRLTLYCLEPGPMLDKSMGMARSTILFSATLSPLWYFKSILGGRNEDVTLRLASPFPRENLLIFNEDRIETRFRQRARFIKQIAEVIHGWSSSHKGNVMVFFPSYKYLLDVLEEFCNLDGDFDILLQNRDMDEAARDEFLKQFENYGDKSRIAFCVMGGVFGEGIDLTGNRLTSVIIVGVGLPQISPETEVMRAYYDEKTGSGFSYAYVYPGINKVLQASGRLIRTETDKGALLLIDSRFAENEYMKLLPEEWHPIPRSSMGLYYEKCAREFWLNNKVE